MTILNTSIFFDTALEQEGRSWVKSVFVPKVEATTRSIPAVFRVAAPVSAEVVTFAVQVTFATPADAMEWDSTHGAALAAELAKKWGERAVSMSSMLQPLS